MIRRISNSNGLLLSVMVAAILGATASGETARATPEASQGTAGLAEVVEIGGGKYFEAVHSELIKASNSIRVVMYSMATSERVDALIRDLIDAHNRRVDVTVVLDHSYEYEDGKRQKESDTKNDRAFKILQSAGIDVRFAAPGRIVHDKLIVVDGRIVILGSANWTESALTTNSETSALIHSPELATEMLERTAGLGVDESEPKLPVRVSNSFLKNPELGPRMVSKRDERAFDVYLLMLKQQQRDHPPSPLSAHCYGGSPLTLREDAGPVLRSESFAGQAMDNGPWAAVDYDELAEELGIRDRMSRNGYRRQIAKTLRKLANRYRLIEVQFEHGGEAQVKLQRMDPSERRGYFNIPEEYWSYGWNRRLDLDAKFAYMINIYKTETSDTKPWWSLGQTLLAQDFHVAKTTLQEGLHSLQREDLLEIRPGRVEEGEYEKRDPNSYRLKPMISPEEMDRKWQELEAAHGMEAVARARKLAGLIDMGNNHEAVEDFVRIIGTYGYNRTARATRVVAQMRADNPGRNIGYVVGILKRRAGNAD